MERGQDRGKAHCERQPPQGRFHGAQGKPLTADEQVQKGCHLLPVAVLLIVEGLAPACREGGERREGPRAAEGCEEL